MPRRIREFCLETGQDEPTEPAAVVRCVLESLALGHARVVKLLDQATGADPDEIHIVGGGAQNELLCRWTANAVGRPVLAGPVEAAAIGNLVVQAIALGELASIAEARDLIRGSFEPVVYDPEGAAGWEEARERFQEFGDPRSHAGVES
jgi:rhamnulokinase